MSNTTPAAPPPPPAPPSTACTSDEECNFADPCQPTRCVASPARDACGHRATPEGSCVCFERTCTLRPSTPRISRGSCTDRSDCNLDVTIARCEPGIPADPDVRVRYSGPLCACDPKDQRCHLQWFDPVSCTSTDDCWVDEQPVPHAIRRPPKLKGRAFRGCVDGERVPACVDGRCTLNALKC